MLKNEKELINNKVTTYQKQLEIFYLNNIINDNDIILLLNTDINEFLKIYNKYKKSLRNELLLNIYFCPFILCDQDYLSDKIKNLIPYIITTRYNMELEELDYYYNNDVITEKEYKQKKQVLTYSYYKNSQDGTRIYKKFYKINK